MRSLVSDAAAVIAVCGVVVAAVAWVRTRRYDPAVPALLDLLLAAGLLRLTVAHDWRSIASVALVAGVRHLAVAGLRVHRA